LGRSEKVIDGIAIEIAFTKRRRISCIEELAGVPDLEVDT
jgi:hypothetical protein